ncbi:ATP-binding cassette domain-containing protein [Cumulibacter soli]|uniref:ATP-binding cassette domain-containing protein n=1 Tax=Cumulibacter soli TaxID=2546344 RepID=UPI0010671DB9|nr:ABC transporter ATP-binding protein [Cumulibacter soli]
MTAAGRSIRTSQSAGGTHDLTDLRRAPGIRRAFLVLLAAAVAQGVGIAAILPFFHAIADERSVLPALAALLGLWLAWGVLQAVGIALARSHGYALAGPLQQRIGAHVSLVPPGSLSGPAVGTVSRLAVGDVMNLITRPAHLLDPLTCSVVIPVTALTAAAFVEPVLGLCALVLLPLVLAAHRWCGARVERSDNELHEAAAEATAHLIELAELQPVLRSAGRADDPQGRVGQALDEVDRRTRRMLRSAIPGLAGYTVVVQIMTALLVALIGVAALNGWIDAASILVLAVLVVRTGEQLLHAGEHAGASRLAAAAQRRIDDFLATPKLPEPAREPVTTRTATPPAVDRCAARNETRAAEMPQDTQVSSQPTDSPTASGPPPAPDRPLRTNGVAVSLEDVSVVYADGTEALRDLSIDIPAGAIVALVGASGAGKSTIVQLLTRMLDPTSGAVRLDGVDLRDLGSAGVAQLVAPVFQQTYLFDDTLRANIALGRPGATAAEIQAAGRVAGLDEVVARLPSGWDASVGEGGMLLSSGERQRVAIARAVLKRAPLLVLDEFTSVLDARTEAEVIAALAAAVDGSTVVIVTHSPAVIAAADTVITITSPDNATPQLSTQH